MWGRPGRPLRQAFRYALGVGGLLLAVTAMGCAPAPADESNPEVPDFSATLVAADDTGAIYTIDPATGNTTLLGNSGVALIDSMAYEPQSETIFAGTSGGLMYRVDPATQVATPVVLDDGGGGFTGAWYSGMSVHPTSGQVFVTDETECSAVFAFNPGTAVATLRVDAGMPTCYSLNTGGLPIEFDAGGTLHMLNNYPDPQELHVLDPVADTTSVLQGTIGFVGFPVTPVGEYVTEMAMHPETGITYASLTSGEFATIELTGTGTINVTYIATLPVPMKAMTFLHN